MDSDHITYFAETDARNKKMRFGIKAKDRLKHVYVIGKTGMGKSTLLENMAIQDIQNGNGIAFVDPHGGTAERLLDYIPESRIKDVLYFAPFDLEYPISFNIMEDIGADKRHLVVNGLMSTFEKIWVDAWSARMAYILNNTLLALLEYPGSTLLGVNRMLSDKVFRNKVVDNITDPSVRSFWVDEFAKYTERFAAEATPAIQNKVGQFTSNPLVRNIIGQAKSSFDIREIMDKKKILIINLSKGRVGEGNANLLGSMLITKIYLAAMSRADKNESELAKLPNFYLYVDEFQSFANKSFADILSEARKYKLNLTIAHQYIEQMEEEVRDAVFGNVGTMIAFRVGAFDSEVLEKEFAPTFMAADLVNLGFAQIYLKLMINGVSSQPFSATTLPLITRPEITYRNEVVKSSRDQFGRPRATVEKNIVDWHDVGTARESNKESNKGGNTPEIRREARSQSSTVPQQFSDRSRNEPHRNSGFKDNSKNNQVNVEVKQAFMKIAEELKEKEAASSADSLKRREEPISLSDLRKEKDKKNPTKENLASLKDALASVISKPKMESVKSETKQENKSENKIEDKTEHKTRHHHTEAHKEVPESVLRELLK
ncbi:MAG: type IV secretion system DNA-binding domain-containing protein [Minisyncoccia bacterium]